jgi:hypothetical protein
MKDIFAVVLGFITVMISLTHLNEILTFIISGLTIYLLIFKIIEMMKKKTD